MKYIDILNKKITNMSNSNLTSMGLSCGKMGICIYCYHLAAIEKRREFRNIADAILVDIVDNISEEMTIDVEEGLAGIGLGINYILKEKFVEGNVNELLKDIDDVIFKEFVYEDNSSISTRTLLHLLFYLYMRLRENNLLELKELLIKLFNLLSRKIDDKLINEPSFFSIKKYNLPFFLFISSKLLSLNIHNQKITHTIISLSSKILSNRPLLYSNRLYLLFGVLSILPYLKNYSWIEYANYLYSEISVPKILKEFRSDQIFPMDGLSMIYLIGKSINAMNNQYHINYDWTALNDIILNSNVWEELCKNKVYYDYHKGLFNGFPGVVMILSNMLKL